MSTYVVFNCRKCGRKYQVNDVKDYHGLCPTCLKHRDENVIICVNQKTMLV